MLFRACQALMLCVSDDAAVEAVLWGENGAGPALVEGLVIDCSCSAFTSAHGTTPGAPPWR